jgi:hypothetical protein
MKKYFPVIILFVTIHFSHGQVTYVGAPNLVVPIPPATTTSVNLNAPSSYEYRGINEIILKPGFEVVQGGNTNPNKYFWGYIEYFQTDIQYAIPELELDAGYATTINGKLYFVYDEKYNTGVLNYKIYDYARNTVATPVLTRTVVGRNYFTIDMNAIAGLVISNEQQRYFILEILNDKNEKTVLRFKHP